jgi:PAS domain S-box-containing protein
VQSANEELQSINEELETSKEELESTNEELTTVNEEMTNRNAELSRLNSDLVNFQKSTRLAIILLGRDLTIRRFSAPAENLFNLQASDVGRSVAGIRHNLDLPDLETLVSNVIATLHEQELEVRDKRGSWYLLRVRPYVSLDNKVDGAVLVLVDIDSLKQSEQAAAAARDYAEAIVNSAPNPLLILDGDLRVQRANEAFYKEFKVVPEDSAGRLIYDLGNGQWNIPRLRELLEEILPRHNTFKGFEVRHEFETIGLRTMLLNGQMLREISGRPERIVVDIQDVTQLEQYQASEREAAEKFKLLFERSPLPKWVFDLETLRFIDVNEAAVEHYGHTREEFLRMSTLDVRTPKTHAALQDALARPPHRPPQKETVQHLKKNGEVIDVEVSGTEVKLEGRPVWLATINDVTLRKRAEEAMRASESPFASWPTPCRKSSGPPEPMEPSTT